MPNRKEFIMKRPTKKAFYEYMSERLNTKYKSSEGYLDLLDIITVADKSEESYMDLAELTLMSKTDRLIYRNLMACQGKEMTPKQVDEYLIIVEYALEYVS